MKFGLDFSLDFGSNLGPNFGPDFGLDFGPNFGKDFGPKLCPDFGKDFDPYFGPHFGLHFSRSHTYIVGNTWNLNISPQCRIFFVKILHGGNLFLFLIFPHNVGYHCGNCSPQCKMHSYKNPSLWGSFVV